MLLGLGFGFLFPKVYLFLISSGGFAILFTYVVIMATHIRFRKSMVVLLTENVSCVVFLILLPLFYCP